MDKLCVLLRQRPEDRIGICRAEFPHMIALSRIPPSCKFRKIGCVIQIVVIIAENSRFHVRIPLKNHMDIFPRHCRKFKRKKIFRAEIRHIRQRRQNIGVLFHRERIVERIPSADLAAHDKAAVSYRIFRAQHIPPHHFQSKRIIADAVRTQRIIGSELLCAFFIDGCKGQHKNPIIFFSILI